MISFSHANIVTFEQRHYRLCKIQLQCCEKCLFSGELVSRLQRTARGLFAVFSNHNILILFTETCILHLCTNIHISF